MSDPSRPIAVIDSGLGGLTVTRAIRQNLPGENVLYFGDTARVPYGAKSPATITAFVRQIIRFLLPMQPKHILIACNTATALALPTLLRERIGVPISGVILPGARAAIAACGSKRQPLIGIIATEATVRSRAYEAAIGPRRHQARLLMRSAPLLVPIIEEGRGESDPLVRLAVTQYIGPMVQRGIDVLLLGCTHYPILGPLFAELAGPAVKVIDSSQACAEDVARRLKTAALLSAASQGWLHCFVTDDTPRFKDLAARFLGADVAPPEYVPFQRLAAAARPSVRRDAVTVSISPAIKNPAAAPA